jgi:TonB family protein
LLIAETNGGHKLPAAMKNKLSRVAVLVGIGAWVLSLPGLSIEPEPISKGERNRFGQQPGLQKALEFNARTPQENFHKRLGAQAKSIKFKMLVRKEGDTQLAPEYAWATKAKVKGTAPQVVYPYEALLNKEPGRAVVRFRINFEGRVDVTMVLESTKPEFGRAAQAAIETMTFTPAKQKNGSPALVLCDAEFEFAPDGTGDVLVSDEAKNLLKTLQRQDYVVVPNTDLDSRLHPVNTANPVYPTAFLKVGAVGTATIEFIVSETGGVSLPRVVSATEPEFGAAAAQAVSTWQFDPPVKNGKTVASRARIEIEFNPKAGSVSDLPPHSESGAQARTPG